VMGAALFPRDFTGAALASESAVARVCERV
jgi:hypothetical protein